MIQDYKCKKCDKNLIIYTGKFSKYGYCSYCFIEQYISLADGNCCYKPEIQPVKISMTGGGYQVRQQCITCGNTFGLALKRSDFDLDKLSFRDNNKIKEFEEERQKEYEHFKTTFDEYRSKHYTFDVQFPGYSEYLNSEQWKKKRALVLKRDGFICQSCLENNATQVHHLTYKHVFNEPLFDLVSVCKQCHDSITNMDRLSKKQKA